MKKRPMKKDMFTAMKRPRTMKSMSIVGVRSYPPAAARAIGLGRMMEHDKDRKKHFEVI